MANALKVLDRIYLNIDTEITKIEEECINKENVGIYLMLNKLKEQVTQIIKAVEKKEEGEKEKKNE